MDTGFYTRERNLTNISVIIIIIIAYKYLKSTAVKRFLKAIPMFNYSCGMLLAVSKVELRIGYRSLMRKPVAKRLYLKSRR